MLRLRTTFAVLAIVALGSATVAFAGTGDGRDRDRKGERGHHDRGGHDGKRHHRGRFAVAKLRNADGERVGSVWMHQTRRGAVRLFARVRDLPPGYHGFHVHTTGQCERPTFESAGGHLDLTGADHGSHAGDLPSLLVMEDGTAMLATATDRFTLDDLRDQDGAAVMVHSGPDNFANIPARYGGPDEETRMTGDAGSRLACGVVR